MASPLLSRFAFFLRTLGVFVRCLLPSRFLFRESTTRALTGQSRALLTELENPDIDIFEQQASFGGAWNYSDKAISTIDVPQINPNQPLEEPIWLASEDRHCNGAENGFNYASFTSPMYEHLETNIPHFLMKYSDDSSLEVDQLFPSRQSVTGYLERYGQDIKHLVHFQTQVRDVRPRGPEHQSGWLVQTRNLLDPRRDSEGGYDAVVVANGHYTVPNVPDIKGIREWDKLNPGVISHSKTYRVPEPFSDKKVLVIGNSASGLDIASQIVMVSRKPILLSARSGSFLMGGSDDCKSLPEIDEFLSSAHGQRAIRFSDGHIESDIDLILFCTGYLFSFPFLSSLSPAIISTGDRVQHLYKQIFYIPDPTLVFVGLPYKIIPFRTVQGQSAVFSRVWSHQLSLPSKNDMHGWEESRIVDRGSGKHYHVLPIPEDFEYLNELVDWAESTHGSSAGFVPPRWTKRDFWLRDQFPAIKKAFANKGEERHRITTVEELGFDYGPIGEHRASKSNGRMESPVCG